MRCAHDKIMYQKSLIVLEFSVHEAIHTHYQAEIVGQTLFISVRLLTLHLIFLLILGRRSSMVH